ncbi:M28 family peptidase [Candidatus Bathyarchaeota archaeon]|nr:M28 family peptidase [Candidatus Bathyarchaeota archaeon]
MKRIVSACLLVMLLTSVLYSAFKIMTAEAVGTIYIRADGSIDPPTAPIQRNGDLYTFTDNIYDSIAVQRSNIIIDGAGFTLQGSGSGSGFFLSNVNNVTIDDADIKVFQFGILLQTSSNNSIHGNNITASSESGIYLYMSSGNNAIFGNNIINNQAGIKLGASSGSKIYHNNLINNIYQVQIPTVGSMSAWDDGYPSGGNYWNDYTGTDANGDGICDNPYVIDANNTDRYPLVHAWNSTFSEQQVVALVNGSRAYNYDLELENIAYGHYAFRSGGSIGANETANWIKTQFESFGLVTHLEPFSFTTWDVLDRPWFLIDDDGNQNTTIDQIVISPFQCEHYSWPTPEDGVFADLVILLLPSAADRSEIGLRPINMTAWNAVDTTGKIVLIGREVRMSSSWHQTYVDKLNAQPPAAVVYTWWFDWMSFVPDFFNSAGGRPLGGYGPYYWNLHVPVGFVNYEDGLWIRNRENTLNVFGHVSIRAVIGTGTHYNVIGKISGYENPEKQVIISGHYDTVMTGGFCDNGAGTAGVIELAKVFSNIFNEGIYKPRYTLLFIVFASEEIGLVGSINYIRQHKSEMPNITAVINLDCIGSDDFAVMPTDSANGLDLDEVILDAAEDLGITAALETPGASDHESFRDPSWADYIYNLNWGLEAGISDATPVESSALLISRPLFYFETPSGWIHTSYDNSTSTETFEWVEAEDLGNHIKIAALTIVRVSPDTHTRAGDVNADGSIDIFDCAIIALAFSSTPSDPNWNLIADINSDGIVDIFDLVVVALHFGETS